MFKKKKKKKEEEAIAKIIYSRNRPQSGCNSGVCDVKSADLEGMERNGTNAKRHACCAAPFDKLEKKKRLGTCARSGRRRLKR